jgi:hypothetical protein
MIKLKLSSASHYAIVRVLMPLSRCQYLRNVLITAEAGTITEQNTTGDMRHN